MQILSAIFFALATVVVAEEALEARGNCFYPSSCSTTWAGKCEDYCGHRGFSHMDGEGCDGWFDKRCCCNIP